MVGERGAASTRAAGERNMMKDRKQVWVMSLLDPETNISVVSGVYDNKEVATRVAAHERKQDPYCEYRVVESTLWMWEEA
jgi:hypothetical protein